MNISLTKAKLFVMRYDISQVSQIQDISHIVIITDSIHAAKYIFDIFIHSYQLQSIAISSNLRKFFNKNNSNFILFWNCPSNNKWPLYLLVDKKSKFHRIDPILPNKTS